MELNCQYHSDLNANQGSLTGPDVRILFAPPVDQKIIDSLQTADSCSDASGSHNNVSQVHCLKRPRIAKSGYEVEVSKVSDVAIKQTADSSRCCLIKSQQRLGVGISSVKRNNGYSYTADIKRNSKKVYLDTYPSNEKAKEIHDIFVFREAQTKHVASDLTNHTWNHCFVNKQLHLRSPELSLTTTWEDRYSAYDRFRTKCFTDQYQSHQVEFSTLNTKRLNYNPYLRPYPLYFTQQGIPRESQQTCKATSYQLHQLL
jgi:hypothetical protein